MLEHANILLIEDNPGDARLVQEVLKSSRFQSSLSIVPDGVEALAFLHHEGMYSQSPTPDIILLDLNLPCKDGREVLAEIKEDSHLCHIPVIVLSTSEDERDVLMSYNLHANCYIVKPTDIHQFTQTLQVLEDFWLQIVQLPPAAS